MEGKIIFDIVDELSRKYIDVEVEVELDRREYAGRSHEKRFRVVGVIVTDADDYHLYITEVG
ncbi:transposase (ISH8) [Natrialba taiwanensis DSM 12281]|uniref:Transposase (ISH8) n=1 Tax=Natrialba taiwanensis DSM 12281 TaxID=1230458 RepID=M0A4G8_9EURY|nr:transposase (ISH8) [Natrialba taiwanensis DSM 12281]